MKNNTNIADFFTMNLSSKASSAEYFRIKVDGTYSIRVITTPEKYYKVYSKETGDTKSFNWFEKASQKFLCHIIDRTDNKIKLYDMPKTVAITLQEYSKSEDYAFNSFPMPYDINITVKNASSKEVSYVVTPRKETKLTKTELEEIEKLQTPKEILEKMIGKKTETVSNSVKVEENDATTWVDEDGVVQEVKF